MSTMINTSEGNVHKTFGLPKKKYSFNMRRLKLTLKYRPDILKLVMKMRQCIRKKNGLIRELKQNLKCLKSKYGIDAAKDNQVNISEESKSNEQNHVDKDKKSQKSSTTQTDTMLLDKSFIDRSTLYEISTKDSFSQTMMDASVDTISMEHSKKSEVSNIDDKVCDPSSIETSEVTSITKNCLVKVGCVDLKTIDTVEKEQKTNDVFTQTEPALCNSTDTIAYVNIKNPEKSMKDSCTQSENIDANKKKSVTNKDDLKKTKEKVLGWTKNDTGEEEKSIAEQVKEVAQSAMQESGMVYVESAGMYYDYKTGYYYNSELGLYYHTDTGCYYYYSDDQKTFVFHSYPDRSLQMRKGNEKSLRKPKKHKKANKADEVENLTKTFSQDEDGVEPSKLKRKRMSKHKKAKKVKVNDTDNKEMEPSNKKDEKENNDEHVDKDPKVESEEKEKEKMEDSVKAELEDGECSDSDDDKSDSSVDGSDISTSTASEDESVAKHHPPCMRIVVCETNLPKLKVGSLFLVTKDGGTIGREGEHHSILLKDFNVSRNHLDIKFDSDKRIYTAVDLGSKNGTILNGVRMSDTQEMSQPMEVVHGSTLQLGETKLLCHIHAGNDTCGHCEPGLIMEAEEKESKAAYTRTCSIQKQHQLELARLKNKYAPKLLEIEETAYNDRAQTRRETVGSSHHSEKTQQSDVNSFIPADNKGFKLLEKMGWSKGEGLGKDSQGDTEPIPLISNEGKSGLGAPSLPSGAPGITSKIGPATMRLAARTKMLQPPAKAFQHPTEDDDSD